LQFGHERRGFGKCSFEKGISGKFFLLMTFKYAEFFKSKGFKIEKIINLEEKKKKYK